jgi:hypothetical protein
LTSPVQLKDEQKSVVRTRRTSPPPTGLLQRIQFSAPHLSHRRSRHPRETPGIPGVYSRHSTHAFQYFSLDFHSTPGGRAGCHCFDLKRTVTIVATSTGWPSIT